MSGVLAHRCPSSCYFASPSSSLLEEVKELYLEGAHQNGEMVDPDLQTGLGVLFHLSGEFDRAIDAFSAALTVRPEVHFVFLHNFFSPHIGLLSGLISWKPGLH